MNQPLDGCNDACACGIVVRHGRSTVPGVARTSATDPLAGRIILGAVFVAVGFPMALTIEDEDGLAMLGWALAGLGSVLMTIGAVGWGVLAGLRAHDREQRGG